MFLSMNAWNKIYIPTKKNKILQPEAFVLRCAM